MHFGYNAIVLTDPHVLCSLSANTSGIMFLGWQRESEAGLSERIGAVPKNLFSRIARLANQCYKINLIVFDHPGQF